MVQIILLANKNLSRCNSLLKDENNSLYSSLDFVWIKRMKKCLESMVDIDGLKALRSVSGCFVLDITEESLTDKSFLNFDPSECHKYVQYIKSVDEEKILFVIGQYLLQKKLQTQINTKKPSKNNKNSDNVDNDTDVDDDNDSANDHFHHLNVPIVINQKLIKEIKKTVEFNYNDTLIINLLKRMFNTIDELDGSDEENGDSTESELDNNNFQ